MRLDFGIAEGFLALFLAKTILKFCTIEAEYTPIR